MTDRDPNDPDPNASGRKGPDEMNPDQAMASLQEIHRLQDRTREEYVRQGFSVPYGVAMFAGVILVFSGFDVPEPWQRIVAPIGYALILATLFLAQRKARVKRKPDSHEVGFTLAVAALWFVAFVPLLIGAKLLELPAPWTIAAFVCMALLSAVSKPLKRAYASGVR